MKRQVKTLTALCLAAVALMLTAACSSIDDDVTAEEQSQDRGVVKTEFSLSIPATSNAKTRMSEDITQAQTTPTFRGMTGISLLSFTGDPENSGSYGTTITLPTFAVSDSKTDAENSISRFTYTNLNSRLYKDVAIPIGTSYFMFYGVADDNNETDKAITGALDAAGISSFNSISNISFTPKSITADKNVSDVNTDAKAVALDNYLNALVDIDDWKNSTSVKWQTAYQRLLSLVAGSSKNIQALVQEIYTQLADANTTESNKIKDAIIDLKFTSGETETETETPYASLSSGGKLTFAESISGYPGNLGLPDGVVYVKYADHNTGDGNDTKTFKHVTPTAATDATGLNNITNQVNNMGAVANYVYPASLYYRVISPIHTATVSMETAYDTENGKETPSWTTLLGNTNFTGDGSVTKDTRSIAISNPIQYAVARLDTKMYVDKGGNSNINDFEEKEVPLTYTSGSESKNAFKLTGVIVGGQKVANYKFEPTGDTEYSVYDNIVEENSYLTDGSTSPSIVCRTLLLETAGGTTESSTHTPEKVKVALEFEHCGTESFAGINGGRVYPGTKFYLIGTLESNAAHKVFEQDHYTTATFKITSFKNAYNVLPDLRAPKLELGLSVNLAWQAGLVQEVPIN